MVVPIDPSLLSVTLCVGYMKWQSADLHPTGQTGGCTLTLLTMLLLSLSFLFSGYSMTPFKLHKLYSRYGRMNVNDKSEGTHKRLFVAYFKATPQNLPRLTEENQETPYSG
jgi:hypothetical protein